MPHVRLRGGAALRGVHGLLLGFPVALFTSALVTDIAYLKTAELQWTNFSAWLIVGALVFAGIVILLAIIETLLAWRSGTRGSRLGHLVYLGLLVAAWIFGLINAFKHSQDGWSSVGAFGVTLSILCTLLMLVAGFIAYSGWTTAREDIR